MDLAPSGSNLLPNMRHARKLRLHGLRRDDRKCNGRAGHVRNIFLQRVPEGLGEEL